VTGLASLAVTFNSVATAGAAIDSIAIIAVVAANGRIRRGLLAIGLHLKIRISVADCNDVLAAP
jgi:hypothetical protein